MKTIYVLCEGYAEQQFVYEVLYDIAISKGICFQAPIVTTKTANKKFRGGVSTYSKIRNDLVKLCNHSDAMITSMFDLYGLPKDTPGYGMKASNHYDWVDLIEEAVNNDVGTRNIHFNLVVHEFEALLYSDPTIFQGYNNSVVGMMEKALRESGGNPELINSGFDTSPSHRIIHEYPGYSKSTIGTILVKKIGLGKMRSTCFHFNKWVSSMGL